MSVPAKRETRDAGLESCHHPAHAVGIPPHRGGKKETSRHAVGTLLIEEEEKQTLLRGKEGMAAYPAFGEGKKQTPLLGKEGWRAQSAGVVWFRVACNAMTQLSAAVQSPKRARWRRASCGGAPRNRSRARRARRRGSPRRT